MRVVFPGLAVFLWILLGPIMSASQSSPPLPEASGEEAELLAADRHFDTDTAERRLEGWLAGFADSGAMLLSDGSTVVGHESIASIMGPAFANEDFGDEGEPRAAE